LHPLGRAAVALELGLDPVDSLAVALGALSPVAELGERLDAGFALPEIQPPDQRTDGLILRIGRARPVASGGLCVEGPGGHLHEPRTEERRREQLHPVLRAPQCTRGGAAIVTEDLLADGCARLTDLRARGSGHRRLEQPAPECSGALGLAGLRSRARRADEAVEAARPPPPRPPAPPRRPAPTGRLKGCGPCRSDASYSASASDAWPVSSRTSASSS